MLGHGTGQLHDRLDHHICMAEFLVSMLLRTEDIKASDMRQTSKLATCRGHQS